jgi:hypothetical protein
VSQNLCWQPTSLKLKIFGWWHHQLTLKIFGWWHHQLTLKNDRCFSGHAEEESIQAEKKLIKCRSNNDLKNNQSKLFFMMRTYCINNPKTARRTNRNLKTVNLR